jgi:hypothetical protein
MHEENIKIGERLLLFFHSEKVIVWCGVSAFIVASLYFLEPNHYRVC